MTITPTITRAVFTYSSPQKQQLPCREGDIKISKDGVFERQQVRSRDGYHVRSNGSPMWEWVRISDLPTYHTGMPVILRKEGWF